MPVSPIMSGDIVQVIVRSTFQGDALLNVLYYKALSSYADDSYRETLEELAAGLIVDDINSLTDPMLAVMGGNVRLDYLQLQRVYPTRSPYIRETVATNGTYAEDCYTGNVCGVITKQCEAVGRGRSGSFHMGGLGGTLYSQGVLTADAILLFEDIANALRITQLGVAEDTGFRPGTFNPDLGAPGNFNPLLDTVVQQTLRVMRRRTLGVGI